MLRDGAGSIHREVGATPNAPSQYTPPRTEGNRSRHTVREREQPREVVIERPRRVIEQPPSLARELNARLNVRRHVVRAAVRCVVLIVTDAATAVFISGILVASLGGSEFAGQLLLREVGGWQLAAALPLALILTGNYGAGDGRRNSGRLFVGAALAAMLPLWTQLWQAGVTAFVTTYLLTLVPLFVGLLVARLLLDAGVRRNRVSGSRTTARTALVGSGSLCADVYHRGDLTADSGFEVVGFVDTDAVPARGALGHVDDLLAILHDRRVDTVALCGHVSERAFRRVIKAATSAECSVVESHRTLAFAGVHPGVIWRRGRPFIELRAVTLRAPNLLVKRVFDLLASATAMIVLSPLMVILGAAVRIDNRGPIVFGHARLGRHGRYFKCYKFRTMVPSAEEVLRRDTELYALYLKNDCKLPPELDTRITRVGRFLRRTSLDELPQLWNVFKGDMSLVGPRPVVPEELSFYGDEEPLLLSLRPGVTGLWQVLGRSSVKYPARAQLELEYVQTWSLFNDLRILFMTIPAVLAQRGAH